MLTPAEYLQSDMGRALDAGSEPEEVTEEDDTYGDPSDTSWRDEIPPATESRFTSEGYYRRKNGYDESRADESRDVEF